MAETSTTGEAPYGVKKDGTPRRRPGRPPGSRNRPKPSGTSGARAGGGSPYQQVVTTDAGPDLEPGQGPDVQSLGVDRGADTEGGLQRDPASVIGEGLSAGAGNTRGARTAATAVTAAVRKDIRAKIGFMIGMPAGMLAMTDEICGGALSANAGPIADALTDIVVDSPDLVRWFSGGSGYLKWLGLMTALQPVGVAVWQHHITHTVGVPNGRSDQSPAALYPVTRATATG